MVVGSLKSYLFSWLLQVEAKVVWYTLYCIIRANQIKLKFFQIVGSKSFSLSSCRKTQLKLLKTKAFVNGEWVSAKSGRTFEVFNPATTQVIASVPDMDVTDTKIAISAAKEAFKTWGVVTAKVSIIDCLLHRPYSARKFD